MGDRKTIPQRMDDLVRWTGIPAFAEGKQRRRRPLRWLSLATTGAAVLGYVISLAAGFAGDAGWIGYGVLMTGFIAGTFMQVFGPLKPFASGERVDEFDRGLRARAYLFGFAMFAFATVLGLLAQMFMLAMGWPRGAVIFGLAELMLLLPAIAFSAPTAFASWSVDWTVDEG